MEDSLRKQITVEMKDGKPLGGCKEKGMADSDISQKSLYSVKHNNRLFQLLLTFFLILNTSKKFMDL